MTAVEIVGGVLLLIASLVIIMFVMLQESKQAGMGAMTGGANENFIGKNGSKTKEAFLAKMTKGAAIAFFVLSIVLNLIVAFL